MNLGIFKNMSNDVYHRCEGLSNTAISALLKSPKKYKMYADGTFLQKDTFNLGNCVHTLVLEADKFTERFLVAEKRRTEKFLNEIKNENGDIIVITQKQFDDARFMADAINEHPVADQFKQKGHIEASLFYYDNEFDAIFKSRPDFFNDEFCIDIKTTQSCNVDDFSRSIASYGYHRQAAIALEGLQYLTKKKYNHFLFLCVEKEPPYCCECYVLSRDDGSNKRYDAIAHGRREIKKAVDIYKKCLSEDRFPAYNEQIIEVNLPFWVQNKI